MDDFGYPVQGSLHLASENGDSMGFNGVLIGFDGSVGDLLSCND